MVRRLRAGGADSRVGLVSCVGRAQELELGRARVVVVPPRPDVVAQMVDPGLDLAARLRVLQLGPEVPERRPGDAALRVFGSSLCRRIRGNRQPEELIERAT